MGSETKIDPFRDFLRAAAIFSLFQPKNARGPRGRRDRRKRLAWMAGIRSTRGEACPYQKLTYQRVWVRGLEHQKHMQHRTFRPRIGRARNPDRWSMQIRWHDPRPHPLRFDRGIDDSPVIDALNAIRGFMRSHIPPANPLKECPPPCP